ncbi:hypothetical protein [Moheibacter sediminis]|uniref:Phage/plasmid replication protein, gene II/X family n=1 Tax=Moheibacter sediminis TaxID=1434700 RepID=A0A1W2BS08_9FLAO|nr:hypothetical protein [Moheibacter sediminis]SMC75526.1 hypothetical protein SAMN06296427_10776 [Moheibacter sediminis]
MIDYQVSKVTHLPKDLLDRYYRSEKNMIPFEWRGTMYKPIYHSGNELLVKSFNAELEGIRLNLRNDELIVSNSLHKFQKENNYSDFAHSELVESIDRLSEFLGINSKLFKLSKLEIGVNTETEYADEYWNSILHYKNKPFNSMLKGTKAYGKKIIMEQISVKSYNKTTENYLHYGEAIRRNLLRTEIELRGKKQMVVAPNLESLKSKDVICKLRTKFLYYFERIIFDELFDLKGIKNQDLELLFAGKNSDYWKTFRKVNMESYKKRKQKYNRLHSERKIESFNDEIFLQIIQKMDYLINE